MTNGIPSEVLKVAEANIAHWKAIFDNRPIDTIQRKYDSGTHVRKLKRGSAEWTEEFSGIDWLDHRVVANVSFRASIRHDLDLLFRQDAMLATGQDTLDEWINTLVPPR